MSRLWKHLFERLGENRKWSTVNCKEAILMFFEFASLVFFFYSLRVRSFIYAVYATEILVDMSLALFINAVR